MGLATFLKDGEEVLIPSPMFVSYAPAVILAGGKPVEVPTYEENEFRLSVDDLEKHVSDKTRALIINSPNNPTGAVLTKKDLEEIANFAVEHDLMVLSDEVYEHFVYDVIKNHSIASLDGMFERTITINGFSKTFAMTGWRLGFVAAPSWVIEKMVRFQMYNATCPVTFAQYAAAKALEDERSWKAVEEMRKEYDRRRNLVWKRLNEMGLPTLKPKGAFYIFPRIRDTGLTDKEFSELMLKEAKVAVVPGSAFGKAGEGYIRISYATAYEKLEEAMDRMESVLKEKKLV
jgi:aminotransferase